MIRSRILTSFLMVATLLTACGGNDTAPPTTSTTVAPTTSMAATTTSTVAASTTTTLAVERLESFVSSWSEANDQGIVLAIAPAGEEAQVFAAGYAEQETGAVVDPDDLFYIGSITKTVVATVMLQLVEEGLVDLDATVDTYLSEVLAGEAITVRQVLSHQSGVFNITDYPGFVIGLAVDPFQEITPEQAVTAALDLDRLFAPGERFSYSNTNYLVAGLIIEAVTGNSLSDELAARIFEPLGLDDMRLAGEPGRALVNGYTDLDGDFQLDATEPLLDSTLYTAAWGAGGLAATAEEVATFASGVFEGRLLDPEAITTMTSVAGSEFGYGLGVVVEPLADESVWGHGGGTPGYLSQFYYFPEDGLVMVALTNGDRASVTTLLQAAAGIVREP